MSAIDDDDLTESWIEVTPQSLGYQPPEDTIVNVPQVSDTSLINLGEFHTNIEEQLFTRLLSEAQDHSDRASETAPRSPPPSREGITPAEPHEQLQRQSLTAGALLYAAALKASSLGPLTTSEVADWSSRAEGDRLLSVPGASERLGSPSETSSESYVCKSWSFRNSSFMKSRLVTWILDSIPDILSHTATFLLGAATMFFLLRKRIDWSKVVNHLPLD